MLLDWLNVAQVDLKAKNVMELVSMKYLRVQLLVLNLWPRRELGEYEPKWPYLSYAHMIFGFIWWCFGFAYIAANMRVLPFFEMVHNYITTMLHIVCLSRLPLALFNKYKEVTRDFALKIHLFHIRHRSEYAMKTHTAINKICYILMMYTRLVIVLGTVLFNVTPMIINYVSGMYSRDAAQNSTRTLIHAVYYKIPYLTDSSFSNYIFLNIMTWIVSYITMDGILFIDLYMCFMVLHLWGCFKILIHELDTFPRPVIQPGNSHRNFAYDADMFSAAELPTVHEKLKEFIVRHFELMTFVDNMSTVFGPILFVYNIFHLVACCLLLLESSKMDSEALALYGPLTVVLFQHLMELNCVFELLGSVSEKVKDAVYNLPWECMDKSSRLTVLIFLMKVQEPVRVKALGMVNIGVTNMAAILKTSFTYFAFLRTVAE